MSKKYFKSSMGKDGQNSIQKRFVKFVMQEFKEHHNLLIIFVFQVQLKEIIDVDHLFM